MTTTTTRSTAFTSGPWKAHIRRVGSYVTGPDGYAVAQVGRDLDARLIAKAPQMYAAIRSLLADYGPLGDPVTRKRVGDRARALLAEIG